MDAQPVHIVMTQLNIAPLPVAKPVAQSLASSDAWVGFADVGSYSSEASVEIRAAKSPMRNSKQRADGSDYEGWFSPFHGTRAMAFARG